MVAIFWLHTPEQIDFDVDLREIQGPDPLDAFCDLLKVIGRRLGKRVMMGAEGGDPSLHPVLGYSVDVDRVVLVEKPPVREETRSVSVAPTAVENWSSRPGDGPGAARPPIIR
jgi:hypothetical protein